MRLRHVKYGHALGRVERDLNLIIDALNENRLASGTGYRLKRSAHGTGLDIDIPEAEDMAAQSATRMRIVTVEGDYLSCREEASDGTVNNSSMLIYVAKPTFLRVGTLNGLIIDNWIIGITSPGNTRTLTAQPGSGVSTGSMVRQNLNYPYSQGHTIYAIQPDGETAVPHPTIGGRNIGWLDLNVDARNFHQIRIALNACVLIGGVPTTKTIIFEAGPVP